MSCKRVRMKRGFAVDVKLAHEQQIDAAAGALWPTSGQLRSAALGVAAYRVS